MSGGIAYVFDPDKTFAWHCNTGMVGLEAPDDEDLALIKDLIERHERYTGSTLAREVLAGWAATSRQFVKVMPTDYKRALEEQRAKTETLGPVAKVS
jgi:glutamate synthase domain-containing protein 3